MAMSMKQSDPAPDERLEFVLRNLLQEIRESTRVHEVPERFDPRKAGPVRLREFGLPPKPDRLTEPERYAFWWQMFSPPLKFIKTTFSFSLALSAAPPQLNPSRSLASAGTRHQTSANWSGGYITPTHGRMFTEMHGSWQVPTPSPPKGATADEVYRSSTWIGLDGQRRYLDSSLPQIGTAQFVDLVNGQPTAPITTTWWQWWARGERYPPITLSLAVKPGDLVMCSLIVVDRTTVRFLIKNQTSGDLAGPFDAPARMAGMKHPPSPIQMKVSGATAEWVTERPTSWLTDKLYELPDYGTVVFSDCHAISASAPGAVGKIEKLSGARLINMFEVREQPHRIAMISVAEREADEELATFYR
jgi:hypothetical protein